MAVADRYDRATDNPVGAFLDSLLRGTGQVFFQNNPLTGLLFLAGIFWNDITFGLYALAGNAVSTLTGIALGVGPGMWRAGLYGFNGTLVGIAFAFFLEPSIPVFGAMVAAAVLSSVLMSALLTDDRPPLTAPFVFATWFFLFAVFSFGVLDAPNLSEPALPGEPSGAAQPVEPGTILDGFFQGIGQVMFQQNVVTGLLFLAGLLVNSRFSALFAAAGSIIALLVAWAFGASEPLLRDGLFGFNAVLTAIALGGVFFVLTPWSAAYALFGAVITTIAFATLANLLQPWGIPVLTSAFVFTTWAFIAAHRFFGRLEAVPPSEAVTPEGNLRAYRARERRPEETREAA